MFPYSKSFLQKCLESVNQIYNPHIPILIDCSMANHRLNRVFSVRSGNIFGLKVEFESDQHQEARDKALLEESPVLFYKNPYITETGF